MRWRARVLAMVIFSAAVGRAQELEPQPSRLTGRHDVRIKLVYSTGTSTRRGSDFDTFNVTWQLVMF